MPMSRKLKYYRLIYRGFKMKKNDSLDDCEFEAEEAEYKEKNR